MNKEMLVIPSTELGEDPEMVFEIGLSWGIRNFELKTLWQNRVPYISDTQRDYLKGLITDYGVNIVAMSPGFGLRIEATEEAAQKELGDKLPRTIGLAKELDCKRIVIFGFEKTEGVGMDFVIDKLGKAAEQAKAADMTLLVEPIAGNNIENAEDLIQVVEAVNSEALRINWDAGNIQSVGCNAYPDEYEKCKKYIAYCHLKNWYGPKKELRLIDEGDIPVKANLERMKEDGYNGYLAIETHTRWNRKHRFMPIAATKYNVDLVCKWLDEVGVVRS